MIAAIIRFLKKILRYLGLSTPPTPESFRFYLVKEKAVDMLDYEVALPVVPASSDVKTQELTVDWVLGDISGHVVHTMAKEEAKCAFEALQDSNVTLSLVYVDDGGNASAAKVQSFIAKDTIPPDAPGPFGEITLTGERTVDDIPPTP